MKARNRVATMLLAGGQGSRLKSLTKDVAKPAVPFGGKYRIIDFALSNSTNSDIRDIGVLTQYKPFELNSHIGNGAPWDYDRNSGGLRILSPFYTEKGGRWYEGTANSIYENRDYLDNLKAQYVVILSGDHIYKMNYNDLLEDHKAHEADATIAVMEVPWEEASRFGIMNTDKDNRIVEFEEKPEKPKNNLASMGIYVFNWDILREYLIKDAQDEHSDHDFGKNIIPNFIGDGKRCFAYKFSGYWKDVGTVRSYWQANLDLLDPENALNLYDDSWRIYTSSRNLPPHYISADAKVSNCMINEACRVHGHVDSSVLFSSVEIQDGACVKNCVILPGTTVGKNAKLNNCVIAANMTIPDNQVIGEEESGKVYLVAPDGITEE